MENERLILARDHFGVKPLHYFLKDGVLVFGSEQKSIILHPKYERQLNLKALHLHLNLRYTQGNETLFEGIKRVPPAHYAVFENGLFTVKRYWPVIRQCRPFHHRGGGKRTDERFNQTSREATTGERRSRGSVPLGWVGFFRDRAEDA